MSKKASGPPALSLLPFAAQMLWCVTPRQGPSCAAVAGAEQPRSSSGRSPESCLLPVLSGGAMGYTDFSAQKHTPFPDCPSEADRVKEGKPRPSTYLLSSLLPLPLERGGM